MKPKTTSEEEKTATADSAAAESRALHLRNSLDRHSKVFSIIIILAVVLPAVAVGAQVSPTRWTLPAAPDFRMYDVETLQWIKMSDYARKNDANPGRVVFIDFMATWCVACKLSMPDLRALHALYSSDPSFAMMSVTTDPTDNDTLMKQFKQDYFANWTFAIPMFASVAGSLYGVNAYPTYVIVNRDGQIAYRSVGTTPLNTMSSQVDRILNG